MSIRVACPNGHVLRVKDSLAGKVGLCPACKAQVRIPELGGNMSEDDIIDVLGPHDPSREPRFSASVGGESSGAARASTAEGPSPPKKSCSHCNREISSGTHICPFCRTYIANLSDL
ncbi:MAG: hypothetical protein NTW96_14860 [Planctomycetia bacterium]|jgi:hypothetical protein|nr:hypothetical protein [Planctomycetia bacterium]